MIWILSKCHVIVFENEAYGIFGASNKSKFAVTGEAVVCGKVIFFSACLVGAVFRGAYEREKDRSVAFPSVTALPEIFFAVQFDRMKLSTESVG